MSQPECNVNYEQQTVLKEIIEYIHWVVYKDSLVTIF